MVEASRPESAPPHPIRAGGRGSLAPAAVLATLIGLGALGGYVGSGTSPQAPAPAESGSIRADVAVRESETSDIAAREFVPGEGADSVIAEAEAVPEAPDPIEALTPDARRTWRAALATSLRMEPETFRAPLDASSLFAAPPADLGTQEGQRLAQSVPLPVPRPPELRRLRNAEGARRTARVAAAPPAAPPAEEPNFFEKLFGIQRPATPALAYAALETGSIDVRPRARVSPNPALGTESTAATAVYDISARTVTLPNGERLEAHSGLGASMDDPNQVHVKMRGATPPGIYDLTEREEAFHGVRAIRLNPVGGSAAVHGRVGLLAHTYMLGPSGASNGCVSFRDYARFLQAFLRGEVQRLVVIPGRAQDRLPAVADARG
ncbi:DUF2778 domain-containing protein [Methylobacterium sp. A54F]